jgi:hypothetical protein
VWDDPPLELHFMDLKLILYRWLTTPSIRSQMKFDPEIMTKQSKYPFIVFPKPFTGKGETMRVFGEFYSAKWFEKMFNSLPEKDGKHPILVVCIPENDATALSKTGTCLFPCSANSSSRYCKI